MLDYIAQCTPHSALCAQFDEVKVKAQHVYNYYLLSNLAVCKQYY